jgi:tetratricopeptide (TPR) repeat protein
VSKLLIFRFGVAYAVVVGIVLALVPILAVQGVESALALGLLLPPWVAAIGAAYARRHWSTRGLDLMFRAVGAGLVLWAIPTLLLVLSSFRVRQCTPGQGLAFMVLGPALGCALAGCAGVWVAAVTKRPRLAPWVAAAVPLGATILGLWTFYTTPTVYVFGAFAGYFPGAIYDDLVRIPSRYLTYRATILLALVALCILFDALWDPSSGSLEPWRRARSHLGATLASMGMLAVVVVSYWHGDDLGHWISEAYLVEQLGKTERGRSCIVHLPRETRSEEAQRLVDDCDFHVERTRRLVGLKSSAPVTAYFFRNGGEKKDLIGVDRTLIAKPWRREVYLQMAGWPHPMLGHEVVHAVLAEVGRPPFAIAATWGGLVPNPGLIEGAATALAWDIRDGLDPDQWSRIMMDRAELPTAETLMSVRFSALPARRAYMAAGSLVRFLMATRGMQAFLDAYRAGHIDDLDGLQAQWRRYLEAVPVTPMERGVAQVALAQPSIFRSVCPHALAELRAELSADAAAQDDARMIQTCEHILDIEPSEAAARAALIGALARSSRRDEARAELEALRSKASTPQPLIAAALENYADASWAAGNLEDAAQAYDELLAMPQTDDRARQSEVKKLALAASPRERDLMYEMLIDRASSPVVVYLAQELAEIRKDGLGEYLQARQLMGRNRFALALPPIERVKRLGLPTRRLRQELTRMFGIASFAVGHYRESAEVWVEHGRISRAAHAEAVRWLERIDLAETGMLNPKLPSPWSAPQAAP